MKKIFVILFVLILTVLNACGGGSGGGGGNNDDGGNTGVFELIEVKNPPVLDDDQIFSEVINSKTIIVHNEVDDEYYLFTYDDSKWNSELFNDYGGVSKVNDNAFIFSTQSGTATLYIYEAGAWEKHTELTNVADISRINENTVSELTGTGNNLWAFEDNQWECIVEGYEWFISYYEGGNMVGAVFEDVATNKYSLWQYKDKKWEKALDGIVEVRTVLSYSILITINGEATSSLYEYKNGSWQKHGILADKTLTSSGSAIIDNIGDYWVYDYNNNEWVIITALKEFLSLNSGYGFVRYINDNTVLMRNNTSLEAELYNGTLSTQYTLTETYMPNNYQIINKNTIILYSTNLSGYVLLTYDGSTWNEEVIITGDIRMIINENTFYDYNNSNLWFYENGAWSKLLTGYDIRAVTPVSIIAFNKNDPYENTLYQYSGNKWNKRFEADNIEIINTNAVISSTDDGTKNKIEIWCFDGKEWKRSHSFADASFGYNYIITADGKLYYYDYTPLAPF